MSPIVVLRCSSCGATFSLHREDPPVCPSCGSEDVHEAHEPLL